MITFSDVLLKGALDIWRCKIFAVISRFPAGLILWEGFTHWLSNLSEPLSIDTTKLLVQQALYEQERIDWAFFRGYLSLTWGLLEAPREVSNPYTKTPQPSAWVISTLTKLGTCSKAMRTDRNKKLHAPTNTSSQTSDLDADIANYYANPQDLLAADPQLLNRPISKSRTKQDGSAAYTAPIDAFLQRA
jgi:cellobiose phosphorylase